MIRANKIDFLIKKGEEIKFHYNQYSKQRRLIIDKIGSFEFHNNPSDQQMAAELVDLMYWEHNAF